jgi:transposase-like protein
MPWKETDPMTERLRCIAANLNQVYSMIDLCERFGIRRHTGYKGVRRYTAPGLAGLQEKSRAPHRCSHRMSEQPSSKLPLPQCGVNATLFSRGQLNQQPRPIAPGRGFHQGKTHLCEFTGLR